MQNNNFTGFSNKAAIRGSVGTKILAPFCFQNFFMSLNSSDFLCHRHFWLAVKLMYTATSNLKKSEFCVVFTQLCNNTVLLR